MKEKIPDSTLELNSWASITVYLKASKHSGPEHKKMVLYEWMLIYIIITLLHNETSEKFLLQTTTTGRWTNQKKSRDHKIKKLNGAFWLAEKCENNTFCMEFLFYKWKR